MRINPFALAPVNATQHPVVASAYRFDAGFRTLTALRDGTPVCMRAIRPDDKDRLRRGFAQLSPQSVYQRFLHPVKELTIDYLRNLTELDFRNHVGLVLTVGEKGSETLIAVGRFVRLAPDADEAEVAFTVADKYQQRGAASLLMQTLIRFARACGIRKFVAILLQDNRAMFKVLEDSRLPLRREFEDGNLRVVLDLGEQARVALERGRAQSLSVKAAALPIASAWPRTGYAH
ncbi:MAG TPA: GNAT family N-acetyltransferase [Burkholderiaceae bacterium]|nr:GNAT family N-acetyltransferase [Burkholderiaceae bacterium]